MKKVLNVGQCNPDHSSISSFLNENFDVSISAAESHEQALRLAKEDSFDLILINRIYDATGTEGLETIKDLKSDEVTSQTAIMLVSNYEDAQAQAVEMGALPGFGKAALTNEETLKRVQAVLIA